MKFSDAGSTAARPAASDQRYSGRPVLRASGYPRPIPGVPPEHNLRGISFAVANATALLACALTARPTVSTAAEVIDMLLERA